MVYPFGPYIPGKTSSSTPSTSAGESNRFAALKPAPKPALKPAPRFTPFASEYRYVPSYSTEANAAKTTQQNFRKAVADLNSGNPSKVQTALKVLRSGKTTSTTAKKDLETGSIESKTAPVSSTTNDPPAGGASNEDVAQKPGEVTNEQEQIDAAQMAADALRKFQEHVASQNLISALSKLDRGALDQYKGIANDYAARGMGRSGGKMIAEEKAKNEQEFVRDNAVQEVFNFITELSYGGNIEQAKTNLAKSDVFSEWLNTKYGGN